MIFKFIKKHFIWIVIIIGILFTLGNIFIIIPVTVGIIIFILSREYNGETLYYLLFHKEK